MLLYVQLCLFGIGKVGVGWVGVGWMVTVGFNGFG